MASIIQRLAASDKAMKDDAEREALGLALKNAAIDAMMHGIGSKQWISYMSLFADTKQQLERLTQLHEEDEPWLMESRAYMVANAICGADSTTITSLKVDPKLDNGLTANAVGEIVDPPGQPGLIVRPFPIPEV